MNRHASFNSHLVNLLKSAEKSTGDMKNKYLKIATLKVYKAKRNLLLIKNEQNVIKQRKLAFARGN